MSLHDALHRIADEAPLARPDSHEAWRSGQALRRRDRRRRAGTVLAAAAAVVLIAGLLAWLPGRDDAPVAGARADLGVPDHVYAVPDRVHALEDDLAVGRAAAAFVTGDGIPVVVGAIDGSYRLLDLPGYIGNGSDVGLVDADDFAGVALSPDGRRLAYGWAEDEGAGSVVASGVRTVDLENGAISTVAINEDLGVRATRLTWSPGGRWLAWTGMRVTSWDRYGYEGRATAGQIAAGARSSIPVETGQLTIDDDGRVRRTAGGTASASSGGTLALGDPALGAVEFRDPGELLGERVPVSGVTGGPAALEPVGWVGDNAAVVTAEPEDGRQTRLVLVGPEVEAREIGRVDGSPRGLSLATDLMTLDRPTVARPEPDWPWSTTRWVLTGLGIVVVAGVSWILVVSRRRRALGGPMRGIPSAAAHAIRDDRFGPSL